MYCKISKLRNEDKCTFEKLFLPSWMIYLQKKIHPEDSG